MTLVVKFGHGPSYCGFCTKSNSRALCGYFANAKRVMLENTLSESVATVVSSMLPQSKSSVLLLRNRYAGCDGQDLSPRNGIYGP